MDETRKFLVPTRPGPQTAEGHACIFIAVDHRSGECLGIHAARRGNRFEALEPTSAGEPR